MSILNDNRRYGTDQERGEWEEELKYECRGENNYPDFPDKPQRYCEECEFCQEAKRFVQEIVTREADRQQVLKQTDRYTFMDICVRDMGHIKEIHGWDEVCENHGELFERED